MWDTCYGKGEPRGVSSSDLQAMWAGKPSLKQVFKDARGVTTDAGAGRCMQLVLKSYVGQASGEGWKQKRRYSMLRSLGFILRAVGSLWMVFKRKYQDVVCVIKMLFFFSRIDSGLAVGEVGSRETLGELQDARWIVRTCGLRQYCEIEEKHIPEMCQEMDCREPGHDDR